jgi:acetamidase/formamidase
MTQPFRSSRFHYTFGPHEPTLRIEPGASLSVVCSDSDNMFADGSRIPDDQRVPAKGLHGNPMAGPIAIDGAKTGDCLAITIGDIEIDRDWGRTLLAPGHGFLPSHVLFPPFEPHPGELPPRHMYRWNIDRKRGVATMTNQLGKHPLRVKLRPMVGCIGVCPPNGERISTLFAGDYGGNLDLPSLTAGSTLLLPVFTDGALLSMGDIHAAQGHGELIGGGIETSGIIHCHVQRIDRMPLPGPRIVTPDRKLLAVYTHGDLRVAVQHAFGRLLQWLVETFALYRWDAYHLISQAGFTEMGGLGERDCTVAAGIAIDDLPPHCRNLIRQTDSGIELNFASLNDYVTDTDDD